MHKRPLKPLLCGLAAAIGLSALLDGLWLESGLNPGTFSPEQGMQICEAWVDGLQAGGRQRFCLPTGSC